MTADVFVPAEATDSADVLVPAEAATTAPTRTRRRRGSAGTRRARSRTTTEPAPEITEPATAPRQAPRTGRTSAADRAYARRAQRADLLRREHDTEGEPARRRVRHSLTWPKSRASFVLLMMSLLVAGVATTLWLSTQAIADSYRLEQLRGLNARQAEQAEQLQREVTQQESASELARGAKGLGMVPGGDPARIVVSPDGTTAVVGEPRKARGDAPAPAPVVAPAAGTQPAQGVPIEGDQPAVPADGGQ